MKIERKTRIYKGGAGDSVKTTIPAVIKELMGIDKGDKIEWSAETDTQTKVTAYIKKVAPDE